jgi:exosortase C (VPDSG-CTERM-specific)
MADPEKSYAVPPAPFKKFALAAGGFALIFSVPLFRLVRFASQDDLHSYILLIPFVSAYLVWLEKKNLPPVSGPAKKLAGLFFASGLAMAIWHWVAPCPATADALAQTTLAFVLVVSGAGFWSLGGSWMRILAFPFALLAFLIPLPEALRAAVETGLQHGSAMAAGWMLAVSDVPVMQNGLMFRLPGVNLQVAPECSGIHSTMVLFITSLVAGKFFLRRPWRRAVLCLAVIPLALLRNGFRIFVLGELCTHIGPEMLNSAIHRRGGPLFFVLSLLPFFLLLYMLKKTERRETTPTEK